MRNAAGQVVYVDGEWRTGYVFSTVRTGWLAVYRWKD